LRLGALEFRQEISAHASLADDENLELHAVDAPMSDQARAERGRRLALRAEHGPRRRRCRDAVGIEADLRAADQREHCRGGGLRGAPQFYLTVRLKNTWMTTRD